MFKILKDIELGENIDSVINKKRNPIEKKQINDYTIYIYENFKLWVKNSKVIQISIFGNTKEKVNKLSINIFPVKKDKDMGELYYNENEEFYEYTKLDNVCFTIDDLGKINEIFIFEE